MPQKIKIERSGGRITEKYGSHGSITEMWVASLKINKNQFKNLSKRVG